MKQICHILKDWQLTNHYQLVTTLKLVNCQRLPSLLRAFSGLKQGLNGLALPTYNLWFLQKLFQRIVEIYNLAYGANRFSFCSTNVKQSFLKSLEGAEKVQKWPKTSKKMSKNTFIWHLQLAGTLKSVSQQSDRLPQCSPPIARYQMYSILVLGCFF